MLQLGRFYTTKTCCERLVLTLDARCTRCEHDFILITFLAPIRRH